MPKRTCPNGHVYDPSITGDVCPMCPPPSNASTPATHIDQSMAAQQSGYAATMPPIPNMTGYPFGMPSGGPDVSGETKVREMPQSSGGGSPKPGGTQIWRPKNAAGGRKIDENAKRLVGFLVTYSHDPMGKAYNIYEGRNYIGRDSRCGISVPEDNQMSGTHMSILYRSVDKKFKFRDEQSSNGTFINKELLDEGELKNYDVIRAGGTVFIFIPIP